jgi:recombination protein RecR
MLPDVIQKLTEEFEKLPGVGPKSAARMAYHFLRAPKEAAQKLARLLEEVKEKIIYCEVCYNFTEQSPCPICSDERRNQNLIMVVEEPLDVIAFNRIGNKDDGFNGVFHVLGGVISPVNSIGPDELRIRELLNRLKALAGDVELVISTNPNLEGEATAMYLKQEIENSGLTNVRVSRIARGLPTGADLEYADSLTLRKALEGRTSF